MCDCVGDRRKGLTALSGRTVSDGSWMSRAACSHLKLSPEVVCKHASAGHHSVGNEALGGDDVECGVLFCLVEELLLRLSLVCRESGRSVLPAPSAGLSLQRLSS
jgi:hypothetical protein